MSDPRLNSAVGGNNQQPNDDWDFGDVGNTDNAGAWSDFGNVAQNDSFDSESGVDTSQSSSGNLWSGFSNVNNIEAGVESNSLWNNEQIQNAQWQSNNIVQQPSQQQQVSQSNNVRNGNFLNLGDASQQQNQSQQTSGFNMDTSQVVNNTPVAENTPKSFKFGYKTVGIFITSAFILIALVLFVIDNTKIEKKVKSEPKTSSSQVNLGGSNGLVEVPDTIALDYGVEALEASGTIRSKVKYLQGHQVIYCLIIDVSLGDVKQVYHYCNYDVYKNMMQGDKVTVKFQQVQTGYISVNQVSIVD